MNYYYFYLENKKINQWNLFGIKIQKTEENFFFVADNIMKIDSIGRVERFFYQFIKILYIIIYLDQILL